MPYDHETPTQTKKIEDCVSKIRGINKRTGRPYTKSEKIAICKSSILSEENMETETFSYKPEEELEFGKLINGVEIFKTGKFKGKEYTEKDLDKIIENFDELKNNKEIGFEPPVRIGHRSGDPYKDALGLVGYIQKLKRVGKKLLSSLDITEPDAYKKIQRKTLKKRSVELGPYEDNNGKKYDLTLWGLGWVDIPHVEGLVEVSVHSKNLKQEESMDYLKEAQDILNYQKPYNKATVKKVISGLKSLLQKAIDDEKYYDAKGLIDALSNLNSFNFMEEKIMTKKSINAQKDEAEIKDEEKTEEVVEEKDKEEETTEETTETETEEKKDEEVEKEQKDEEKKDEDKEDDDTETEKKEEVVEEGKEKDGEKEVISDKTELNKTKEEMTKEIDVDVMTKEQIIEELNKVKEEVISYRKEMETMEMKDREKKVDVYTKDGKSTPSMLEIEKEFVKSLSKEQYDKYIELKEKQPKIVALDAKLGTQGSLEPKTTPDTGEATVDEAKEIADRVTAKYQLEKSAK